MSTSQPVVRGFQTEEDWSDGLVLWEKVFGVGPWLFHSLHRGHDDRELDDCGGVWVEGDLVSAVDFFVRPTYDAKRVPRKMGGIGSVATLAEFRGKGHSSKLMERALQKLEERGCDWSILFTGVNGHYEKHGWRTMRTFGHKIELHKDAPKPSSDFDVSSKDWWSKAEVMALAPLHEEANAGRPLSRQRTTLAWQECARERLNRPGRTTYVATSAGELAAYGVVEKWNDSFDIQELGGSNEGLHAVLNKIHLDMVERGTLRGGLSLPSDVIYGDLISRHADELIQEEQGYIMARPIANRVAWDEIEAAFHDPAGCHFRLDDF